LRTELSRDTKTEIDQQRSFLVQKGEAHWLAGLQFGERDYPLPASPWAASAKTAAAGAAATIVALRNTRRKVVFSALPPLCRLSGRSQGSGSDY
jgi:hypothetical protein